MVDVEDRVLRDLPTFGHIANKSRSLGNISIGNVACSVTPSAIYPLKCFIAISLKNPRAKLRCIGLSFPVARPPDAGVASSFTRTYYFWHSLYSTTWGPNRPVAQSLPHLGVLDITWATAFSLEDENMVLLACNMRSKIWANSKNEIGPHGCHCEMSPSRVAQQDRHTWKVVKPCEARLKPHLQGRTERTLSVRTLSGACFVDIEMGSDWWGFYIPSF